MFPLFDPQHEVRIDYGSHLPHWFQADVSYFVTFRTEDSLPADVARRWHASRSEWLAVRGIVNRDCRVGFAQLPQEQQAEFHERFSREFLEALDKGMGACVLRDRSCGEIVANALRHFDGDRYHLGDFVVMPNHVHLIVRPLGDSTVRSLCTSWKRFTAKQINLEVGGQRGRFWQEESFDHLIRSPAQFHSIRRTLRRTRCT